MASTRIRAVAALFIVLAFTTTAIQSISDSEDSSNDDEQDSQRVAASRRKAPQKRGFGTLADDVYEELLAHLIRGTAPVLSRDNPSFVRDKKVYNHLRKSAGSLCVQRIFSPVEEDDVETLVVADCNGKLLIAVERRLREFLRPSEEDSCSYCNEKRKIRRDVHKWPPCLVFDIYGYFQYISFYNVNTFMF